MKRIICKCSKIFIFVVLVLVCIRPDNVIASQTELASSSTHSFVQKSGQEEYVLDSYDINIVVHENNMMRIMEQIGANFYVKKHGIYRKIPLRNKVVRLDGTTSNNRAKISHIGVDHSYSLSSEGGYKVIKIGDEYKTITGSQDYIIRYNYDLGKDTVIGYDEFYFNLIGDEWDTSIRNITFMITMPKEFDQSLLGFFSGRRGSTNSANISYEVNGNVITGEYYGTINPGEALTVRLQLPEGYFVGTSTSSNRVITYIALILPVVFALIAIVLWYKYGKNDPVIETEEFYPPNGLNSAEIGFLYKGRAERKDVVSLLLYLANKGYIKISQAVDYSMLKFGSFRIMKQKEYDGSNSNENLFFQGLFSRKATSVTGIDLNENFYLTLNAIMKNINKREKKYKIFEKSSFTIRLLLIMMIVTSYVLITVKPIVDYATLELLPFALLFPILGFSVLFATILSKAPIFLKLLSIMWGLGFGGLPWATLVLPALIQADTLDILAYILGISSILILLLICKEMPKRTYYGNKMLGKIKGFKRFLETADKPRLEAMVMQDPSYFYTILPYAYVLGISEQWMNRFDSISFEAPDWYDGELAFDIISFGYFIKITMSSVSTVMSSSPSDSSDYSSGSSGGGCSGGGSGGGGGGSW